MEKEENIKKGKKYLLIGVLVLFLAILGSSVAYYLARVQGSLSGNAAGTELSINVEKVSSKATGDLIPLDSDLETLNLAAAGYDNKGACVDINGYSVCQIYHITLTNNGSVPLTVNGTVTLSGQNVPNIDCATMNSAAEVANNNSCMGGNVFVSGDTLPANDHKDYYVMVYINNLDEPQYDSGEFNGTVTFTTEDGRKVKGRFTKPFNLVQRIETLYNVNNNDLVTTTTKAEVTNNSIVYNYATNVGLMNDRLGGTTTSLDGGNIRYYGETPNNYIDIGDKTETDTIGKKNWEILFDPDSPGGGAPFNDQAGCYSWTQTNNITNEMVAHEFSSYGWNSIDDFCGVEMIPAGTPILWRIIGVFDDRVKIVRDKSIGMYSYDTSASDINGGQGINEWSQADLMKLLNPGYESNEDNKCIYDEENDTYNCETTQINNSLYWNSGSGTCYSNSSNRTTSCDFTSTGLSEEAKEYVVDQTIYLGGFDYNDMNSFSNQAWSVERGANVVQNPSDGITRTLLWTGKVGLIYPSDYGYAADFRDTNCQGNLITLNNCTIKWMKQNINWTVSPYADVAFNGIQIGDNYELALGQENLSKVNDVYPTLLLDSSALAESGNGSKETPYVLTS